jgi:hypothetical protein
MTQAGTAGHLALLAARRSGVPQAVQWARDPRFWYILEHESGLSPTSGPRDIRRASTDQNPSSSAYGIGQFLNPTWATVGATKTSDPAQQLTDTFRYIQRHWGGLENAYAWKKAHGYY